MLIVLFVGMSVTLCLNQCGCQMRIHWSIELLLAIGIIIVLQRLVCVREGLGTAVAFQSVNTIYRVPLLNHSALLIMCIFPVRPSILSSGNLCLYLMFFN